MSSKQAGIKVFCRFRPFNEKQLENNATRLHRISKQQQLIIKGLKDQEISFMFDRVFDMNSTQQGVFQQVGRPVLKNILDGFNGTIMAYGQTSSGKTHTMQGYDLGDRSLKGIMPRLVYFEIEELFTCIQKSPDCIEYKLKVSIFELYLQKIKDLLDVSKNDLKIRQNRQGPYVQDLTQVYVSDKIELFKLIQMGQKNRIVCSTNMNANSSRSHMIFLLSLNQFNTVDSASKTSKLFLIDLAGSQKISKTGAQGKVLQQAKKINLSLTCLGKVIKSLAQKDQKSHHIPYRDSKLTRVIKDSLGGNSKTTLVVTCSPHQMHLAQTISTLRFGQNAQKIKNKPKINRQLTVQQLQKIIEKMETQISMLKDTNRVYQQYIKNQLKAPLPSLTKKLSINQQKKMDQESEDMLNDAGSDRQQIMSQKNQYLNIQQNQIQIKPETEQRISTLEDQLNCYKKSMIKQAQKFYELKKQYTELHQNMKSLVEQNNQLHQKVNFLQQINSAQSLNEQQKIEKSMSSIDSKQIETIKLIVGNIFSLLGSELQSKLKNHLQHQYWYSKIMIDGEQCSQFWRKQKQQIDRQMNQLTANYINLNSLSLKKSRILDSSHLSVSEFQNGDKIQRKGSKNEKDKLQQQIVYLIPQTDSVQILLPQFKQQVKKPDMPTERLNSPKISQVMQINQKEGDTLQNIQRKLSLHQQLNSYSNDQQHEPQIDIQKLLQDHQKQILQRQNLKLMQLESKLDKLYEQYHEMISMQTTWKVECQLYERKLKHKQQKIHKMQQMLDQLTQKMEMIEDDRQSVSIKTKIVKPIKGGGMLFRH